jgi:receptor protein-tyrosine kinase
VARSSRTRTTEEYRIVIGRVLRALHEEPDDEPMPAGHGAANVVMITSARPGEGKSFTALNIAGSIAQHGQREVLLVDVDAKQRPVTHQLGLQEARGLLDLAANPGLRVEDVLVRTAIANLTIMPIGNRSPEVIAGASARPISAVVERLGRRFPNRVIILDAPPCLSTSDPSALAPLVGQIIMVVEAERTQRNEVEAAFDLVKSCPTVSLLLNKIQLTTSYTFGAYHYFGSYS